MDNNSESFYVFETDNFLFRTLNLNDTDDIFEIYSDPKVIRMDYSEPVTSKNQAEELIKAANRSFDSVCWGAEHKATKKILGTCGFKNWNRTSSHAEIGGNLSSELWGRGFANEALKGILKYAFSHMELNKICASTNYRNLAALKLLNKYGFTQEGKLREHHLIENEFHDVLVFSLLKNEYDI